MPSSICLVISSQTQTISYAGTYGIQDEIGLVGQQYSLLVSIFFIAYLAAEYPTNLLMQKFPTGKYLTVNFLLWGVVLSASSSCKSFATLAVARFFLGILESCINPGLILISSSWWTKEEQVFRVPFWAAANGIFGAPSGLIFYGISKLHVSIECLVLKFDFFCLLSASSFATSFPF